MAKISRPMNIVSADVTPSVAPSGAGSVAPDETVDAIEPVAIIQEPEPVAPEPHDEIAAFLENMRDGIPALGEMHTASERLSREAGQRGDHANSAKLSRIGNAIAEMRNGLISALS